MASTSTRPGCFPALIHDRWPAPWFSGDARAVLGVTGASAGLARVLLEFCRTAGVRGRKLGDASGEVMSVVLEVAVSKSCLLRPLLTSESALRLANETEEAGVAGMLRTRPVGKSALTSSETLLGGL